MGPDQARGSRTVQSEGAGQQPAPQEKAKADALLVWSFHLVLSHAQRKRFFLLPAGYRQTRLSRADCPGLDDTRTGPRTSVGDSNGASQRLQWTKAKFWILRQSALGYLGYVC